MLISFQAALTNSEPCGWNKTCVQIRKAALQLCYHQNRAENWHNLSAGWVPWDADSEVEIRGRMFIKERPQDQHLWKRGGQSRSGQRETWTWVQPQPQPCRTHKGLWLWLMVGCGPLGGAVILTGGSWKLREFLMKKRPVCRRVASQSRSSLWNLLSEGKQCEPAMEFIYETNSLTELPWAAISRNLYSSTRIGAGSPSNLIIAPQPLRQQVWAGSGSTPLCLPQKPGFTNDICNECSLRHAISIWKHIPLLAFNDCAGMLSHFGCVWLFAALWTVAHQAPLSMGIFQARILEWAACPQGIFPTQGSNPHLLQLLHSRWILYPRATSKALMTVHWTLNFFKFLPAQILELKGPVRLVF